jgi:hypothetical protein
MSRKQVRNCGRYNAMRTVLKTTKHAATATPPMIHSGGLPSTAQPAIVVSTSSIGWISLVF